MPFTKEFIEILLAASVDYKESMILDYNLLEDNQATKMYADFVKSNINSPIHNTKVEPFELFMLAHEEPNAWAWHKNEKYVICIHLSLFKIIEKRIREKFQTLPNNAKEIISRCHFREEEPAEYLVYQVATDFTFYHELAHLFQSKKSLKVEVQFERYNLHEGPKFDELLHAMEIDADIFAAEHINAQAFQFWNKFPIEHRTKETLEVLISLSLISCFILFYELSQCWDQWYTRDYDHPNSLIRVCYILDALIQTAKSNEIKLDFEIDSNKIMQDTFTLANHFISDSLKNGLDDFATIFNERSDEIKVYLDDEMFPFMKTVPFLNINDK